MKLGAKYKLWQFDDLKGLEGWVALILRYSQLHHSGKFAEKDIWREVKAIYGADVKLSGSTQSW